MLSLLTKLNSEMSELKAIQSPKEEKLTFEPDSTKKSESIPGQGFTDRQVWGLTDPNRSKIFKIFSNLVRACTRFLEFFRSWSYSRTRAEPLGPGPTRFCPLIPVPDFFKQKLATNMRKLEGFQPNEISIDDVEERPREKLWKRYGDYRGSFNSKSNL